MLALLQQIPIDRALLIVFLAGGIWQKFLRTAESQKSQGVRIGIVEEKIAKLEGLLAEQRKDRP